MSLAWVTKATQNQVLYQRETLLLFVKSSYVEFWVQRGQLQQNHRDREKEKIIP